MNQRPQWLAILDRIARPMLENAARRQLRAQMPVEVQAGSSNGKFAALEGAARTLAGVAPWLELDDVQNADERALQAHYRTWARAAIESLIDPASPDYSAVELGAQILVDAAMLCQALLYAPRQLRESLDDATRAQLIHYLQGTRAVTPPHNNWLLFSAAVETALYELGAQWDGMRVDYALRQHEAWYVGDGCYRDGPEFHFDYYNSLVIHPLLVLVARHLRGRSAKWDEMAPRFEARATRHAALMERMISPEGALPPIGRSLAYRFGVLHGLSQAALLDYLPADVPPAAARCALFAVMNRMIDVPGTFDDNGWLRIGWCGHQPEVGERYINTGSLYACARALVPLGLAASAPFWADEDAPWTAVRAWSGEPLQADHAL